MVGHEQAWFRVGLTNRYAASKIQRRSFHRVETQALVQGLLVSGGAVLWFLSPEFLNTYCTTFKLLVPE